MLNLKKHIMCTKTHQNNYIGRKKNEKQIRSNFINHSHGSRSNGNRMWRQEK